MAHYFLQDTPLAGLERQMMSSSRRMKRSPPAVCGEAVRFGSGSRRLEARVAALDPVWDGIPFADRAHRARMARLFTQVQPRPPGNRLAAFYLLTASETLWERVRFGVLGDNINLTCASLRGISTRDYTLYQAAVGCLTRTRRISASELADPELVDDMSLRLILSAERIARYGANLLTGRRTV